MIDLMNVFLLFFSASQCLSCDRILYYYNILYDVKVLYYITLQYYVIFFL